MRTTTRALAGAGIAALGLAAFAALRARARHPVGNRNVPQPAKSVDLQKYIGRWYEIARYEQRFERGCEAATADYSLREDGRVDVLNRCRKENGRSKEARGVARIVDPLTGAKLKVSFLGPFYGDYWILDRADDYGWSIVGEPSGRYLWLLSRDPHLSKDQLEALVNRVSRMGYDASMLVFDRHQHAGGGRSRRPAALK